MLLLTFTALEGKSLLLLQTRGLVVFPLTCSHGCFVFPFLNSEIWFFHVLCYICEIALFPIFLFSHALFVPLNIHLSLSNRIPHSVSKLGALGTPDNNFWCAKGGMCLSQQDWCFGLFWWWVVGFLGFFFLFFWGFFPICSVITGLAMARGITMLQGITGCVTSQVLQVIEAGSLAP